MRKSRDTGAKEEIVEIEGYRVVGRRGRRPRSPCRCGACVMPRPSEQLDVSEALRRIDTGRT